MRKQALSAPPPTGAIGLLLLLLVDERDLLIASLRALTVRDDAEAPLHQRSMTTSLSGREQQISRLPAAGGTIGSGR